MTTTDPAAADGHRDDHRATHGHAPPRFPIVGIGASAGGLEALDKFLHGVPADSGVAYVVVQHLDPTQKGLMPELLQRATEMPVAQVEDQMTVEPDHVYVIPSNRNMSIQQGVLRLSEPAEPRGLRLPIDYFFRSLAADQKDMSVGVILSGMGSDGSAGLRAIIEAAGLALVQEPGTAKFDSMPRSAINAGLADIVAAVEELPQKILDFYRIARVKPAKPQGDAEHDAIEKVLVVLRSKTGQDFSLYKTNTVRRRVERRMGIHQIARVSAYVQYLRENPQEVDLLFQELLIGVTTFFRDPAAWERLMEVAIPALLESRPNGGSLRAWSAGCSTGEEAYSLAMAFKETLDRLKPEKTYTLQIFATDLDRTAIARARYGHFQANIAADVSPERLRRYFVEENGGFRAGKEIREMVTFATQNVIMDAPFTRLDLLICRNLLIYLVPALQQKLLPLFHYALNPGGVLFLGSAETIVSFDDLFAPIDGKLRLYKRRESVQAPRIVTLPAFSQPLASPAPGKSPPSPGANLQSLAERVLLQRFTPPAVLVDGNGDILFINGRTGKYLEPAAGKANWNIFAMAREGLRAELGAAFQRARAGKDPVTARATTVEPGGSPTSVAITVQLLDDPEPLRGMVFILFSDLEAPPTQGGRSRSRRAGGPKAGALQREVEELRETLQSSREEMQSSQEELRCSNEELQSTNEELQSTNEELTTSREEMQSLNEELQTVNAEQLSRMEELTSMNDDVRNLLNSTEIATVFLDSALRIRRFTSGADKLFKLLPSDVGRPLSDIANELRYPELTEDAEKVLRTLAASEKEVAATGRRWLTARIMPYRTTDDVIGGVVITFADISAAKSLEAELRTEIARLEKERRER